MGSCRRRAEACRKPPRVSPGSMARGSRQITKHRCHKDLRGIRMWTGLCLGTEPAVSWDASLRHQPRARGSARARECSRAVGCRCGSCDAVSGRAAAPERRGRPSAKSQRGIIPWPGAQGSSAAQLPGRQLRWGRVCSAAFETPNGQGSLSCLRFVWFGSPPTSNGLFIFPPIL